MATYATRLTTAFGAGVDRVRRWSQGSAQEEQQQHLHHPQRRFATTPGELAEVEDAISDSPPQSPPLATTPALATVLEGVRVRAALEDSASEQTLVAVESPVSAITSTSTTITTTTTTTTTTTNALMPFSDDGNDNTNPPPPPPPVMSPPERGHSSTDTETAATATATTGGTSPHSVRASGLPEDDGQRQLRQKLSDITQSGLPERDRARKMHQIMTEKWHKSRASKAVLQQQIVGGGNAVAPTSPSLPALMGDPDPSDKANPYKLLPGDSRKTYYADPKPPVPEGDDCEAPKVLGCSHYRRGVRLQCSTCERWHTCRFCHDENEDHALVRRETKNMLCMHCGRPQPAQQDCRFCGVRSAKYYCDKCKLWDDDPQKSIYHCNDCGICRIGQGLGKDFFHCKKCGVCMSIALENSHRCIERSTECDCPICGEFMFTSTLTVVFMTCGHSIHHKCYYEHMKNSYRCPTCARTIINMESQFRALDIEIENQPLPYPYSAWRCLISCNDCSAKSNVQFHFLGLKCDNCSSYNTSQVRIIRPEDECAPTTVIGVPAAPQPISHTGIERMSLSVLPVLNSPPRAASTEHGNAVVVGADSGATISNANRVLAAADEAIQSASGLGDRDGAPIIDDGWESEDSADFLDEVDDEDDSEAGDDEDYDEDDDDDDEEFVELINLRGHI